jgi:hypothetical protein
MEFLLALKLIKRHAHPTTMLDAVDVQLYKSSHADKVGGVEKRTAVFMFIVPIGAIVSSMIVYGEGVALSTVIGCLLAFVAVALFNMKSRSKDLSLRKLS